MSLVKISHIEHLNSTLSSEWYFGQFWNINSTPDWSEILPEENSNMHLVTGPKGNVTYFII